MAKYVLLSILTFAAIGCGSESNENSVSGIVTVKGKPLAKAALQFFPVQGRPAIAMVDQTGKYQIDLPPGDYQVTVSLSTKMPPGWKPGDPLPQHESTIPAEYATRARTPLKATVSASQTEPIDFVLP